MDKINAPPTFLQTFPLYSNFGVQLNILYMINFKNASQKKKKIKGNSQFCEINHSYFHLLHKSQPLNFIPFQNMFNKVLQNIVPVFENMPQGRNTISDFILFSWSQTCLIRFMSEILSGYTRGSNLTSIRYSSTICEQCGLHCCP